jgi:hypothetical protein
MWTLISIGTLLGYNISQWTTLEAAIQQAEIGRKNFPDICAFYIYNRIGHVEWKWIEQ